MRVAVRAPLSAAAAATFLDRADDLRLAFAARGAPLDDLVERAQAAHAEAAGRPFGLVAGIGIHPAHRDARRRHRVAVATAHGRTAARRPVAPRERRAPARIDNDDDDEEITLATKLNRGDRVEWSSSQGTVRGTVEKKLTKPIEIEGHHVAASTDNPEYLVKSARTGAKAAHKPGALKKKAR
jgi:hypothetical protein